MNKVFAAMALTLASGSQANVLDFNGAACAAASSGSGLSIACADDGFINQDYGDAPGVDVTFGNTVDSDTMRFFSTGYTGLSNVAYTGYSNGAAGLITLAAATGFTVTLNSFQLSYYLPDPLSPRPTTYTITDLATSASTTMSFTSLPTVPFTAIAALTSTAGFKISFGPDAEFVGIDNISFNVSPVPEPMGVAIALAGGFVLLGAKRFVRRA